MPECPSPLLGRNFLSALGATPTLSEDQSQGVCLAGLCIIQDTDSPTQNIPPEIEKHRSAGLGSGNPREDKVHHSYKNHLKGN